MDINASLRLGAFFGFLGVGLVIGLFRRKVLVSLPLGGLLLYLPLLLLIAPVFCTVVGHLVVAEIFGWIRWPLSASDGTLLPDFERIVLATALVLGFNLASISLDAVSKRLPPPPSQGNSEGS